MVFISLLLNCQWLSMCDLWLLIVRVSIDSTIMFDSKCLLKINHVTYDIFIYIFWNCQFLSFYRWNLLLTAIVQLYSLLRSRNCHRFRYTEQLIIVKSRRIWNKKINKTTVNNCKNIAYTHNAFRKHTKWCIAYRMHAM